MASASGAQDSVAVTLEKCTLAENDSARDDEPGTTASVSEDEFQECEDDDEKSDTARAEHEVPKSAQRVHQAGTTHTTSDLDDDAISDLIWRGRFHEAEDACGGGKSRDFHHAFRYALHTHKTLL